MFYDDILAACRAVRASGPAVPLWERHVFVSNLIYFYQVIVATEDLFDEVIRLTPRGELRDYFAHHADEERDHARWLDIDLAVAGVDIAALRTNMLVAAMVGSQFYLMKYVSPCAFLGYMLVLEDSALSLDQVAELEKMHGVDLCRTVRFHVEHDVDHSSDLKAIVDGLPAESRSIVADSALMTATYLLNISQALAAQGNHHGI